MVIDVFTFNGELDLLEIRLNILDATVDQFIIVEATETFSGQPKPLYYEENKERYKKWQAKIKYHIVRPEDETRYVVMANGSPNTIGAAHWKKEFCQKECIKDALTHLKDEDVCFIGDVDEIWDFKPVYVAGWFKLKLKVYTYYLNNRSSEEFWGTLIARYGDIKDKCFNHLRSDTSARTLGEGGWHFTSMGGYEEVKRKLSNSYTRESYWTPEVEGKLQNNIELLQDFLGRGFNYHIDESEWPQYLKDNRKKYEHLLR